MTHAFDTHASDPKPPRKPVLPDQPDAPSRPNRPVEPAGDAEHPIDVPPEEVERRDPDPAPETRFKAVPVSRAT